MTYFAFYFFYLGLFNLDTDYKKTPKQITSEIMMLLFLLRLRLSLLLFFSFWVEFSIRGQYRTGKQKSTFPPWSHPVRLICNLNV